MPGKAQARPEQTAQTPVCDPETLQQTLELASKNFLDRDVSSMFSERVHQASRSDRLRSMPLIACVDRTYRLCCGLSTILRIANNNKLQEDGPQSDEPPLSPNTVYTLLDIGEVLSEMLIGDIETLTEWAHEHGVIGEGENDNG